MLRLWPKAGLGLRPKAEGGGVLGRDQDPDWGLVPEGRMDRLHSALSLPGMEHSLSEVVPKIYTPRNSSSCYL